MMSGMNELFLNQFFLGGYLVGAGVYCAMGSEKSLGFVISHGYLDIGMFYRVVYNDVMLGSYFF
jgi:hypothetical protein